MTPSRRIAGPMLLVAGALIGCTDVAGGGSSRCAINSDCPLPEVCIDERCALQCRIDTDCPEGEQCQENICVDPLAGCLSDADCRAFGLVCDVTLRRCVPMQSDMLVNMRDGGARDAFEIRDARPPVDARPPPIDARPPPIDARPPPVDARPPPVDARPPPVDAELPMRGDGRYGDPCRCAADCQSGFCLQNPYNDFGGQCSARCGQGADQTRCPDIDRCVQARVPAVTPGCPDPGLDLNEGDIVEVCAPNETGIPCRGAADCFIDGICITPPDPFAGQVVAVQPVCGARCDDDLGCPTGFRCQAVPTQGGQRVNVCAAAVEITACPDGRDETCDPLCSASALAGRCIAIDNVPGFCSCACRSAIDCPLGFACSQGVVDTGDPRLPGICLPIAGYTCPQGDAACMSLLCAPPQGSDPLDRCVAPCNGPADCPQGYSCERPPGAQITVCVVR